jgi:mRNA interferase RelE/StbE
LGRYRVEFRPAARREFLALPPEARQRLDAAILALGDNPRPTGVKALKGGPERLLRVRVGVYRIIYTVQDEVLLVLVVRVAHRREAYR